MRLKLNLSMANFAAFQVGAVTFFVLLGAATYAFMQITGHDTVLGYLRLVDIGRERSFSTYFSALNLLLASVLLLLIYRVEKTTDARGARYWLVLALLLLYMSVDEASAVHENLGRVQKYLVAKGVTVLPSLPSHQWLPFGTLLALIVAVVLLPFVRRLPRDTAVHFVTAGFLFLLGAVGFEALGTWMLASGFVDSTRDLIYQLRRLCEEGLEMYAIAIFNIALYREILKREVSFVING